MDERIDLLTSLLGQSEEYQGKNAPFSDISATVDEIHEEICITSNLTLSFIPENQMKCKKLVITNATVELSNLDLLGTIVVNRGILILKNCHIHDPLPSSDYLITSQDISFVTAENCLLENAPHFGICVDNRSTIQLTGCTIQNIHLFGIVITSSSIFR